MELTDKQKGIALSLIGVLIITPDTLLIRLINLRSWELLFYRGLVPFICLFLFLLIYYKKKFINSFLILGMPGLLYAVLIALGKVAFDACIKYFINYYNLKTKYKFKHDAIFKIDNFYLYLYILMI